MACSSAKKVREFRQRQKAGLVMYRITVEQIPIIEALVAAGWLDRTETENPSSVEAALSKMLVDWGNGWWDLLL